MATDLLASEAGFLLLAEEFDFLKNKQILRIMLALSKHGPLTQKELVSLDIGKPYRVKNVIRYLLEEGKIIRTRLIVPSGKPHVPPLSTYRYFIADEFMSAALVECIDFLERSHRAFADGFVRLGRELKPMV